MIRESLLGLLGAAAAIREEAMDLVLADRPAPRADDAMHDETVTQPELRKASRKLFLDGHYALAVEEGYKCLNNLVKQKSGLPADGCSLMNTAFSVNNPILKLNSMRAESQRNQQHGYMQIFAGC